MLDPIFSLTRCVRVAPGATARVAFWTLVASSRDEVLDLVDQHRDAPAFDRAATLAWTQGQVELHHLGITSEEAMLFQRLAGHILYNDAALRPSSDVLRRRNGGQAALWAHEISGDLPIVLVRIDDADDLGIVRQLLRAFEYWRLKQLNVDLVILNERSSSYEQDLQTALETLSRAGLSRPRIHGEAMRGGVFILRSDIIPAQRAWRCWPRRAPCCSVATAASRSRSTGWSRTLPRVPPPARRSRGRAEESITPAPDVSTLEFFNGLGGFAADGEEYVTILRDGQCTPAPWINVIANPEFGFQVSTDGSGCTWSGNSRENRLTPWSNDPVEDRSGEVLYVRDDDTGALFGPTALPVRHATGTYVARHGRGYSRFEHTRHGIALDLLQFVPDDESVKVSRLRIRNLSARTRHLTVTAYVGMGARYVRAAPPRPMWQPRWILSPAACSRATCAAVTTPRVAFTDLGGRQTSWTGNRMEFIGRNGSLERPAALAAGRDAIGPYRRRTRSLRRIADVLYAGRATPQSNWCGCWVRRATASDAQAMIERWRGADIDAALQSVREEWSEVLDAVTVQTPDRVVRYHDERLVAVSDARLSPVGPQRVLPGERRVRLPRPVAGHHGAHRVQARPGARAAIARGGPAIRRGRRAALVAAPNRSRGTYACLR